jgi:hypothetical protein
MMHIFIAAERNRCVEFRFDSLLRLEKFNEWEVITFRGLNPKTDGKIETKSWTWSKHETLRQYQARSQE